MSEQYPLYDENTHMYYRLFGEYSREYEPTIKTTLGDVKESKLAETASNQKRIDVIKKNNTPPIKSCPFKGISYTTACNLDCAWWSDLGCLLIRDGESKIVTKGKCPISHRSCGENCALLIDGNCGLLERIGENK